MIWKVTVHKTHSQPVGTELPAYAFIILAGKKLIVSVTTIVLAIKSKVSKLSLHVRVLVFTL